MNARRPGRVPLFAILALISAIAAAAWWWNGQSADPGGQTSEPSASTPTGPSAEEVVARKRAARADREISVAPSTAAGIVVVAGSNTPVAGARVLLSPRGVPTHAMQGAGEPRAPTSVVTDAAGQWKTTGMPPGEYNVAATARGYQPGVLDKVRLSPGGDREGLVVEVVEGGHRLHGVVSDLGGGPIPDVLVSVTQVDQDSLTSFSRTPWPAMTDAEGRYEVFVSTGKMVVSTWHPDYVSADRNVKVPEGGTSLDLSLLPGGAIAGVVRSRPDGSPVAGAHVRISGGQAGIGGTGGPGGGMAAAFSGNSVRTDEKGRFRVPGLSAGVLSVQAAAPGIATSAPVEVPLAIAEEVDGVEVWLDPAFTISGFVVRKGTDGEQGLNGVMVMAMSMNPPAMLQASGPSESDGFFEIHGAKPGTYMLMAIGERHVPNMMREVVTVKDADVAEVLLELDPGVYVEGQVTPAGEADIAVDLSAEGMSIGSMMQSMGNAMVRGRADTDGAFRVGPFTPDTTLALAATATADGARGKSDVTLGDEDVSGVTITLTPRARLTGTVRDGLGNPVRGVTVKVDPVKRPKVNVQMSMGAVFGAGTVTDEDGAYVATGLDAGEYRVRVEATRGIAMRWHGLEGDGATSPKSVNIAEGQTERLDLVVDAHDGVIRGRVVGPDGRAVPDAFVRALPLMTKGEFLRNVGAPDRSKGGTELRVEVGGADESKARTGFASRPVLTDEDGRFEIERLRRGNYDVVAEAAQGASRGVTEAVQTGEQVLVTLAVLSTLTCTVTDNGAPAASFSAEFVGPTRRNIDVDDPSGVVEARRLAPGSYEVKIKTDRAYGSTTVEVVESEPATCEVALATLGRVRGVLVNSETDKPLSGLSVIVQDASGDMSAAMAAMLTGEGAATDGSGAFTVEELAPGRLEVLFLDRAAALMGASPLVGRAVAVLAGGETLDLGTIKGWRGEKADEAQRGTLGWSLTSATFEDRPGVESDTSEDNLSPGVKPLRLWVASMTKGGPAESAGVQLRDEVTLVDGASVESLGAYPAEMKLSTGVVTTGQTVELGLSRGGEAVAVTLTAVTAPEE